MLSIFIGFVMRCRKIFAAQDIYMLWEVTKHQMVVGMHCYNAGHSRKPGWQSSQKYVIDPRHTASLLPRYEDNLGPNRVCTGYGQNMLHIHMYIISVHLHR